MQQSCWSPNRSTDMFGLQRTCCVGIDLRSRQDQCSDRQGMCKLQVRKVGHDNSTVNGGRSEQLALPSHRSEITHVAPQLPVLSHGLGLRSRSAHLHLCHLEGFATFNGGARELPVDGSREGAHASLQHLVQCYFEGIEAAMSRRCLGGPATALGLSEARSDGCKGVWFELKLRTLLHTHRPCPQPWCSCAARCCRAACCRCCRGSSQPWRRRASHRWGRGVTHGSEVSHAAGGRRVPHPWHVR